jgi:D-sedoheptulose 7-phosphate isomerase
MKFVWWTANGVRPADDLVKHVDSIRAAGQRIVTTNGCFDLLHPGHIQFLQAARGQGDRLIVGLNSDESVHRLKGAGRPLIPQADRAAMLLALRVVDEVVIFDDLLPDEFLSAVRPHIHCKAGDYTLDSLPEAKLIANLGGEVRILDLQAGYSTTRLVNRVIEAARQSSEPDSHRSPAGSPAYVVEQLLEGANVIRQTAYKLAPPIIEAAQQISTAFQSGHKVLVCGNGGSAADAQHLAAELVGRFLREREPLPAIALTTDTSILTALGNDYGFDQVFAKQVAALGQPGDILIALSTSGASPDVLAAVATARQRRVHVIGLTGARRSPLSEIADLCLAVPASYTPHIQQAHISILHIICDLVEQYLLQWSTNRD